MSFIELEDKIKVKGQLIMIFTNVKTGKVRKYVYKNMFLNYGKYAIAQRMAGDSDAGEITYCALGTGTTAPAKTNTGLQTEHARKLISGREYLNEVFTGTTYFTTSEANGTLREAALFGNGVGRIASSTPGSGQIYARTAINRTKSANDTLTLQWSVTIVT